MNESERSGEKGLVPGSDNGQGSGRIEKNKSAAAPRWLRIGTVE